MDQYSFLNTAHTAYFAELYDQYLINPGQVEPSWRAFFQGFEFGIEESKKESGHLIKYIKLIPIENSLEISHLLIGINTSNNDIFKVIEFGKNKSKITLEINNIFYNSKLRDDIFIFKENEYLDYYIEKL